jgi:tetratricopeptide (TPR) repeat protein
MPDNLQALVLARFDQLEPQNQEILQVASAIGHRFDLNLLRKAFSSIDELNFQDAISNLVDRDFIRATSNRSEGDYQFTHILFSDTIYGTLLNRDRKVLHEKIATSIEEAYSDRLDEQVEILAKHYSWSSRHDKALHYLILAGSKAAGRHILPQARMHYQDALDRFAEIQPSPEQEIQVKLGLGEVCVFAGEYEEARSLFQSALEISNKSNQPQDVLLSCEIQRKISTTYERQGEYDLAMEMLMSAETKLHHSNEEHSIERAKILNDAGWLYVRRGNLPSAEKFLNQALAIVLETTHFDVIASIYNRLGGIYFHLDDSVKASEYVHRSMELSHRFGDIAAVARAHNNLGLLKWKSGEWDAALEHFAQSVEINDRLGDAETLIHLHGNIGVLQKDKGNLEIARKHIEISRETAKRIGHTYLEGASNLQFALYLIAAKKWKEALKYCDLSELIFQKLDALDNLVDLLWIRGKSWLGLGELDKAEDVVKVAFTTINKLGTKALIPTLEQGRIQRLRGNLSVEKGEYENADRILKECVEYFSSLDNQIELGRTYADCMRLDKLRNDMEGAKRHYMRARTIFNQLGAMLDVRELSQNM